MKAPHPSVDLALRMLKEYPKHDPALIAVESTRVVCLAEQVRRLTELGCKQQLTERQDGRLESLGSRADMLLKPYGLSLGNPWGLCFYALPIGHDGSTQNGCIYLA